MTFRGVFHQNMAQISLFNSVASSPLELWRIARGPMRVRRDADLDCNVIVLTQPAATEPRSDAANSDTAKRRRTDDDDSSSDDVTPYDGATIVCPNFATTLGLELPVVCCVVNIPQDSDFSFEVTVLDRHNRVRRVRASTFQRAAHIDADLCLMPLDIARDQWSYVWLPLDVVLRQAFGAAFRSVERVQLHASAAVRRVFLCNKLYDEQQLPPDFRLWRKSAPVQTTSAASQEKGSGKGSEKAKEQLNELFKRPTVEY